MSHSCNLGHVTNTEATHLNGTVVLLKQMIFQRPFDHWLHLVLLRIELVIVCGFFCPCNSQGKTVHTKITNTKEKKKK